MSDSPINPTPINPTPIDQAPLCCPACGYNLTGVCTPQKLTGNCPECGEAFVRQALMNPTQPRRPMLLTLMILELFLLPLCVLGVAIGLAVSVNTVRLGNMPLVILGLGILLSGGMLAWQYDRLKYSGIPREYRQDRVIPFIVTWVLFTGLEFILACIYTCGGCLYMLNNLNLSNMH